MSLALLSVTDEAEYWEGATHVHPLAAGVITWKGGNTVGTPPSNMDQFYYDRFDRMYGNTSDAYGGAAAFVTWDPLAVDNGVGAVVSNAIGTPGWDAAWVGEWDKAQNIQRIYAKDPASAQTPFLERNPVDYSIIDSDAYPNLGTATHRGSIGPTEAGYYSRLTTGAWVFFEGINTALHAFTAVHDGTALRDTVLAEVDLTTGFATIVSGIPCRYASVPTEFEAPTFAGDNFDFTGLQFIPDDDSTPDQPKGRIMLFNRDNLLDVNSDNRVYVALYDWNPQGVVGGSPNRVHKRLLLLTRFTVVNNTPTSSGGIGTSQSHGDNYVHFHKPTNTIRAYYRDALGGSTDTNIIPEVVVMGVWSAVPTAQQITQPTELRRVKTNARVDFASDVTGDLGEPIAGAQVDFTLQRVSTPAEAVGTGNGSLGSVAGDFSLVNAPIDLITDVLSIVAGVTSYTPIAVGSASAGNEVEVNLTNGDLQFFQAGVPFNIPNGDAIVADYRHFSTPASPSHGTLLTQSTRADETGQVFAEVQYPDDSSLEDEADLITASTV